MGVSKERRKGYLIVDQTATFQSGADTCGLPPRFEADTSRCNHCERMVLHSPTRQRERVHCYNCDSYICDQCAAVAKVAGCRTFLSIIAEADRLAHRGLLL